MLNCKRCAEIELLLEKLSITHWEAAQRFGSLNENDPQKQWAGDALRAAKDAADEAQRLYNEHLASAHPRSAGETA